MPQSMKDIFYHALLTRAAYANLDENSDTSWNKLIDDKQSAIYADMADFI